MAHWLRGHTDRFLSDDRTFLRLQRSLRFAFETRQWLDRRLVGLWKALGVVSYYDVAKLEHQLDLLEQDLERQRRVDAHPWPNAPIDEDP